MSTVIEIEAAIEHLPAHEVRKLTEWLLSRSTGPAQPKTGAELAKLWPSRFHLQPEEAKAMASDLKDSPEKPVRPSAWE